MERRGCGLGCIITALGLMLSCCLLPYLISSIYSIVSSLLQVPVASTWLWGDWLSGVFGPNNTVYMILAEGPICCVGMVALLIAILGGVMMIGALGPTYEYNGEEEIEPSEELVEWYDEQN
ncbi:hypothetical protein ACFLYD_04225 [Chloroflexota bacterium]